MTSRDLYRRLESRGCRPERRGDGGIAACPLCFGADSDLVGPNGEDLGPNTPGWTVVDGRADLRCWNPRCPGHEDPRLIERALEVPVPASNGAGPEGEEPSRFIEWPAFWTKDRAASDWLVEDILARGRGHSIFAGHKVGKSLLMLWLSVTLAQRPDVLVVYLDYEMGEDDLYERLADMGCGPDSDLSRLRYALLPSLAPLDTSEGGRELAALVGREMAAHPGCHPVVVIDTIGRAVQGEENPADTIREFYRCTGMELRRLGVTWARLDHAGKDPAKGARGSSAKGDDVDVVWQLVKIEGGLELVKVAARMGWVPERTSLRLEEGPLRFVATPTSSPAGTLEAAELLDGLRVPLDASRRVAATALRSADQGRRTEVLLAALRYRRERAEAPEGGPGTTLGTTPRSSLGTTPGTTPPISSPGAAEPPPEPPGTTLPPLVPDLGGLRRNPQIGRANGTEEEVS
jgi:hypothetical protein